MMNPAAVTDAEFFRSRLRHRYRDSHRYMIMEEVPLGCSFIDFLVFCFYRSDGYGLMAFEIKISRGDWLREKRNMVKNSPWRRVASSFVYVAPEGVIKEGESGPGCGIMVPHRAGLRMIRKPERKTLAVTPELLAMLIRRAGKEVLPDQGRSL